MFKKSQILQEYPWVELTHKNGNIVNTCEVLSNRDARLYHVSDMSPEGVQILDEPKWYFDFKHSKGQTQTIEITEECARDLSENCGVPIETYADGVFWF